MNNPIVVSTIAYDGYDLETSLAGIAEAGAENVELAYSEAYTAPVTEETFSMKAAEAVLKSLEAAGLRCPCLAAHMDMSLPCSVDKFKRRIDFAKALGAGTIVSTAGPIANRDVFLDNIKALGEYAAEAGLTICLENMGDGRPNIIDSAAPAMALVKEIGLPSVKINYDFANLLPHCAERLRPEEDYKLALPRIGYFHVKDVVKDHEGRWHFPAIGTGMIDFEQIFSELAAHPEPIPLSLELSLRITRLPDATPIRAAHAVAPDKIAQALKTSLQFVRQQLAGWTASSFLREDTMQKIAIGCDPNASQLKETIKKYLTDEGFVHEDFGSDDPIYANVAFTVAEAVASGKYDRGILLCGTGIGMCLAANKVKGAYAAVCADPYSTERSVLSNNCNILALGAQVMGPELAKQLVRTWLSVKYQPGGRSESKMQRIYQYAGDAK